METPVDFYDYEDYHCTLYFGTVTRLGIMAHTGDRQVALGKLLIRGFC